MTLPAEGSSYSDPSFVKDVTDAFLLPANHKRLNEIGLGQFVEWSLAHCYQVIWFKMLSLEFVKCWLDICFCAESDWFNEFEEPNYYSGEAERGPDCVQCFSEEVKCKAHCLA